MKIIEYKGWKIRRDHPRRWVIIGAPCAPTSAPTLRQAKVVVSHLVAAGKVPRLPDLGTPPLKPRPLSCRHGVSPACDECRAELQKLQSDFGKLLKGEMPRG